MYMYIVHVCNAIVDDNQFFIHVSPPENAVA